MSGEEDMEANMERVKREALIAAAPRHFCQPHGSLVELFKAVFYQSGILQGN